MSGLLGGQVQACLEFPRIALRWLLGFLFFCLPHLSFGKVPKRIVLLTPNLTEIFFAFHQESHVVGVSEFSDYPVEAQRIARIGNYNQPNMEKIVSLKPDLVVALNEGVDRVTEVFRRSSIPLKILTGRTLADYETMVQQIGDLLDDPGQAQILLQAWRADLAKMRSLLKGKVLVQIDHNPIVVAGQDTFLSEILERCGLKNSVVQKGYPRISQEFFFKNKPDYILLMGRLGEEPRKSELVSYWQNLTLTKTSRVISAPDSVFSRLGPRLASNVLKLCQGIRDLGSKH